jgi:predicted SprT family Zn-dependent metalloprotease
VVALVNTYLQKLELPSGSLSITTSRDVFSGWIGRRAPSRIGGAYSMHPKTRAHRVFVHLERLDLTVPHALEVVVAEELIHMRDHIRGDFRRHSHHGHDRIAIEVERVTGFSPEQQRAIFQDRPVRLFRYLYECPKCRVIIPRRRRGKWSCSRCSPTFRRNLVLREIPVDSAPVGARDMIDRLNRQIRNADQNTVHFSDDTLRGAQ